jgi:CheY-like chemotaxis protein
MPARSLGWKEAPLKGRILLVDDNDEFLDSAKDVLEDEGFGVTLARSGEEALRFIELEAFELVLMDIHMAGINGVESFLEMKRLRPDVRVIFCTAHLTAGLIRRAEEEGAGAVLKKPFKTDLLLKKIDEVVFRAP